jgi:phosphoribosylformylglycinamidine synthase
VHADFDIRKDAFWFGEAQSRVVVTCSKLNAENIKHKAASNNIPVTIIGTVTNTEIKVNGESWGSINDWKNKYDTAIEKLLIA